MSRRLAALMMTVVALGGLCARAAHAQSPRIVLTIHWGAEAFPGTEPLDAAIRNVLRAHTDVSVDYFAEYLESEEFPPEVASTVLRDSIRRKFEGRRIDVVIANASAALQFALRYREELFPGVPIVFVAVVTPQALIDDTVPGVTGVLLDTAFGETLELALNLHPSANRVFVVAQAPSVEGYDEQVRSVLSRFSGSVELTYIKEPTVPALLAAVKGIPTQSLILYTRYTPNEVAHIVYPDDIARLIADVAPAPIYTVSEVYVGSGVVGGMIRAAETTGALVGDIARQILAGTPPEDIPIRNVPTTPIFDWRQVQRWGVDPSRLPPASRILFRAPTTWDAYRWYISGVLVVITAQLFLIGALLTQRARRRRAEDTIRTREALLRTSYEQVRQLVRRLMNAQEDARARIAEDLHDDVCQRLATVLTGINGLMRSSGDIQNAAAQQAFAALEGDTRNTFDSIRRLSHELHPATLRVLGLAPALKAHCAEVAKRHSVQVTFTTEGDLRHLSSDVAVCFFRIAQESLRNGIVHGDAHRFTISLTRSREDVEMTISDDGRGFDLEAVRRRGGGLGLVSMEERARLIGANVSIVTGLRQGTTIRVRGPAKPSAPVCAPDVSVPGHM